MEKYKIHDEIICTIDNCTFEHFYGDEHFYSVFVENEDYFLAMGVYDSEENGYDPPFTHCFESGFCDSGTCSLVLIILEIIEKTIQDILDNYCMAPKIH